MMGWLYIMLQVFRHEPTDGRVSLIESELDSTNALNALNFQGNGVYYQVHPKYRLNIIVTRNSRGQGNYITGRVVEQLRVSSVATVRCMWPISEASDPVIQIPLGRPGHGEAVRFQYLLPIARH